MLTVRKITKSFGQNLILKDVSFTLKRGERFGMVGSNGVGKTTLLQIIKGNIKSDLGNIEKSGDIRICYIPQEIMPISKIETGREYLIRIFGSEFASILDDRECHSILSKLSMSLSDIEKPLDVLSGGLKAKVALLPFFLSRADVFLLDEPTNNLDLSVLLFLEQRIIKSLSTFLIVSHDRKFLDRIVSKTVEIDEHYHTSIIYEGGFSEYLKEREKRVRREWQRYKEYQTEIKRLKDSSQGQKRRAQRSKSSSKKHSDRDKLSRGHAKERSKRVEKSGKFLKKRIERIKKTERPWTRLPMKFNLEINERSGDIVFELNKVIKKKSGFSLGPINLRISYGMKVAILGSNGNGKTTLLRLLLKEEIPSDGIVQIGKRVSIGYLPQELNFSLNRTLLTEFLSRSPLDESNGRKLLNRFGLEEADVNKRIKDLSPGERSRLILSILMSKQPNCIILDEPSNHLDLEALTQLESALEKYRGTLIIVSHDRYLLDHISLNNIFILKKDGLLDSVVSYSIYEQQVLNNL